VRSLLIFLGASALTACSVQEQMPDPSRQDVEHARLAAAELQHELQARLMEAMQSEGVEAAIGVCADEAQLISARVSEATNMDVGRTSFSLRNPDNAPDIWERQQMAAFRAAMSQGETPQSMEYSEVVETENGMMFRWMKPIPMGDLCQTCHGTNVAPEVLDLIHELYPEDHATGYEPGQLRGAFTVSRPVINPG